VVKSIQIWNGNETLSLPATHFTYQPLRHIPDGTHFPDCYKFAHLVAVENGYGGMTTFQYRESGDGRHGGIENGTPQYAMSFFVDEIRFWDGVHDNPARIVYNYASPCFNQAEGDLGNLPDGANCPSLFLTTINSGS
jgi:hypothetical protein